MFVRRNNMSKIQELAPFNKACDEFVLGKYILVDIKINSILNIIAEDEKISAIINSCTEHYNFNLGFKNSISQDEEKYYITLPQNDKEIIAFVYNLLYRFKTNNIDFYEFLTTYYPEENEGKEFSLFANKVIIPFKNALNSVYSKLHVLVETDDYQNNIYNKIKTTIKHIANNINQYKINMNQKEEFTMLLNSLFIASDKNDKKMVYSLMIGLDYFTKCNKKIRSAYLTLEECFEKK